jgi:5-methylcytosine-specific restriction endonuclease McrA
MSRTYVPKALRERVAAQAKYRCGYCLTSTRITGIAMEIEHINPEAMGGPTVEDNLWLACTACNLHKSDRVVAADPDTGEVVHLYDPRHQNWREHFKWSNAGDLIIGLTATGRATVKALHLNRRDLALARLNWVSAGWHPPAE